MPSRLSQTFDELRKYKVSDFRGKRDLPLDSDLMYILADICDSYIAGSDVEGTEIRALVSYEISFLFFLFSHKMAEKAVQEQSRKYLIQSLVALLVEDGTFDWRDSTIALSKVFHSAQRIGLNADEFFQSMKDISGPIMLPHLRAFPARDPSKQSIETFGFKEGENADGLFAYVARSSTGK